MKNRIGETYNVVEKEAVSNYWMPKYSCSIIRFLRSLKAPEKIESLDRELIINGLDHLLFSIPGPDREKMSDKIHSFLVNYENKIKSNFDIIVFPVEAKIETNNDTYLYYENKELYLKNIFSDRLERVASGLCRIRGTHLE